MMWKDGEFRWTSVFVFISLVLYTIMGILTVVMMATLMSRYLIFTTAFLIFLFIGIALIEWAS